MTLLINALGTLRAILARHVPRVRVRGRPELAWLLWWVATAALALIFLPLNVALPATKFDVHPLTAFAVGIAQSTALLLTPVRPVWATALQLLAATVMAAALPHDSGSTWPLTIVGMFTLIAHVGLVGARYPRRTALAVWWASALAVALLVLAVRNGRSLTEGTGMLILYPIFSIIVLGSVLLRRRLREVRRELADARHDVEVEQSQRAVAEERTRIARELHDVVAHSMSVIHMQATSSSYRIKTLDPAVTAEFAQIAAGARSALHEMRYLLAVLRDEDADATLTPVPGLGGLPELVESAERAGVPVELRVAEGIELPDGVALVAYRIAQESLSNVIRHAPGAPVRIMVTTDGTYLTIVIENDAATRPAPPVETAGGAGQRGMRERVRLVGGSLETEVRAEGGYRVVARLPIGGHR
ncbi:sensor histidine kinase [Virgisporangium aurantiacum]|uniref:histidine kinase n=1 Tax=Virgisporangium aurantiacum TaxID=175570 RepID=A0A8J4E6Q9_9ACTN|nr:histidine kinase [Virgisporangium aurantiacum]GIJ63686.1 two-component sensor histidine kinase [Virgisporangium aurantiacum]